LLTKDKDGDMSYERPAVDDYGTLADLTASLKVGGPEDALAKGVVAKGDPPGHSLPPGPPPGNKKAK
jgi:hypothetical protein